MTMAFLLDDRHRGFPPGLDAVASTDLAAKKWAPADGTMNLPCLSMDLGVFGQNRDAMFEVCRHSGAAIAPHIKTPMAPALAVDLVNQGAWGISVADLRQAAVMLRHGIPRILIANEIGGKGAAHRLAALARAYPDSQLYLFIHSSSFVDALANLWAEAVDLASLHLLIEVGCGRGGVRSQAQVADIITAISKAKCGLVLAGVAAYEGTANRPDMVQTEGLLDDLFERCGDVLRSVREHRGARAPLILTAGGSSLFDHVIARGKPLVTNDRNCTLILRSGACFFSDHGPIRERLSALARRDLLGSHCSSIVETSFRPALRLWAEVLSVQSPELVICGIGLRDVSHDQGLPVPLVLWRGDKILRELSPTASVSKLNDQHAFVQLPRCEVEPGDVIEFGVKHPCTTIDKHSVIYVLDKKGLVIDAYETFFG
jgi:D-serine dehydratase